MGCRAHKLLRVSFDLFIMRSWDGSSETYGYTRWDCSADDGRTLIHTTFNNMPYFGNNQQAFPDTYPARSHLGCTLAAEMGTLGVEQSWGSQSFDVTSVYHMVLPFPHSESSVTLQFESTMETNKRKFYGLTNVEVDALPELAHYSDGEMAGLWKDLGSADPGTFYAAEWKLVSAGDAAVEFIAKHLGDAIPTMSEGEIAGLIPGMVGGDQGAFETVVFQGPVAVGPLEKAGANAPNPPDRLWRAWDLVKRYPYTREQTRNFRAKSVLGAIHTAGADALGEKIEEFGPPPKAP